MAATPFRGLARSFASIHEFADSLVALCRHPSRVETAIAPPATDPFVPRLRSCCQKPVESNMMSDTLSNSLGHAEEETHRRLGEQQERRLPRGVKLLHLVQGHEVP